MLSIAFCEQPPVFDVIPVQKTRYFSDGIRQLLYSRVVYAKGEGFYFDLMKFERDPLINASGRVSRGDSLAGISFDFSKNGRGSVISSLLNANGDSEVYLNEHERLPAFSDVFAYGGHDEQGWYWGVRFLLGEPLLFKIYGNIPFLPGDVISGNIYAVLEHGSRAHFGAVNPFEEFSVFSAKNHGDFCLSGG